MMDFSTKMAVLLLHQEIRKDFNKNVVVSPLSFSAILNMIAAGSSGPTLKQMLGFLQSSNIDEINSRFSEFMAMAATNDDNSNGGGPVTCFVNGAWVSQRFPLKNSYQKLLKDVYNAEARNVDFAKAHQVVKGVNTWAKSATKGLITRILEQRHITPDTRLILGNALYFKSSWEKPFNKSRTTDFNFYLLNGEEVKIPFMTSRCPTYSYGSFEHFQVLKMPYESGEDAKTKLSMYIFLPNKRDGLRNLLKRVNSDPEFFSKHSRLRRKHIDILWIPKFKFTYCSEAATGTMKKMGLTLPFDEDSADLTEMVHGDPLFVSTIIQKACVEIDEQGTEASAVTFMAAGGRGVILMRPIPTIRFVADHPFVFMIREENSGFVFFVGALLNPLSPGKQEKNEIDHLSLDPFSPEKEEQNENDHLSSEKKAKDKRKRKRRRENNGKKKINVEEN